MDGDGTFATETGERMDQRFVRWADVLVGHCLKLQPGALVEIVADHEAWPLITATYRSALRAGANPVWAPRSDELDAIFFQEANDLHLAYVSPLASHAGETIDARISIIGGTNRSAMDAVTPRRAAERYEALAPLRRMYRDRVGPPAANMHHTVSHGLGGAGCRVVYLGVRRLCVPSLYLDEVDPIAEWQALHGRQQRLVDLLDQTTTIRIEAEG